jgi:hypothetical protein
VTPLQGVHALTARLLAYLVNGADVGVIQGRGGTSFAAEPFESLRVAVNIVRKKLESDEAAEVGVFGLVNNSHAATAQFFNDAVVGDGCRSRREGLPACGRNVRRSRVKFPEGPCLA